MTMGVGVVDWPHGFAIIRDMTKPTKSAVILRWNPAFSSFGTESLVYSLGEMTSHPRGQMDWSVFDYKHVHKGDECYLLKVKMDQEKRIKAMSKEPSTTTVISDKR